MEEVVVSLAFGNGEAVSNRERTERRGKNIIGRILRNLGHIVDCYNLVILNLSNHSPSFLIRIIIAGDEQTHTQLYKITKPIYNINFEKDKILCPILSMFFNRKKCTVSRRIWRMN